MFETLIAVAGVAASSAIGVAAYKISRRNQRLAEEANRKASAEARIEKADALFDDARALKDDYKAAYEALREEVYELRMEVEALRKELERQTKWKGVASEAFHAWTRITGDSPFWWPDHEDDPIAR